MALDFDILLQPKQGQTLDALEAVGEDVPTILGIGGSRGSAKSYDARACAIILAEKYPGIVIYIIRRVLKDLLENHMEKIRLEFPSVHALYRMGPHEYPFPNGSRIVFVYAETKSDVDRVSYGPECTFQFIDQAEQFSDDELTSFRICNRWPSAPKGFSKQALFFNVGKGVGAGYLRRVFNPNKSVYKPQENPKDYKFIQMFSWDNYEWFRGQTPYTWNQFYQLTNGQRFEIFLRDTSEGRKMNQLPKHRRESELMGNFDSFSGQYFSDVWGGQCVIDAEVAESMIQPWWTRWMAQRWGFGDANCHLWAAVGIVYPSLWSKLFGGTPEIPIEVVILYREHVTQGRAETDVANDIVAMTPNSEIPQLRSFYMGSDSLDHNGKKRGLNTVSDTFRKILKPAGIPSPLPADDARVDGWRFVYNCLKQSEMRDMQEPIRAGTIRQGPCLFVSRGCPETIENLPLATRDDKEPNDVEIRTSEVWCAVADAVRYTVKSKPAPRIEAPVEVRRRMLCESITDPTMRHMARLQFDEKEKNRNKRQTWRGV